MSGRNRVRGRRKAELDPVDPDTILALQVIAFRGDWERISRGFEDDAAGFAGKLKAGLDQAKDGVAWLAGEALPPRFVEYLTDGPAKSMLANEKLAEYVSSSQQGATTEPLILQAQAIVADLRRYMQKVGEDADRAKLAAALNELLGAWASNADASEASWPNELKPRVEDLEEETGKLAKMESSPIGQWIDNFRASLDALDNALRVLRRERYSLRGS